MVIGVLVFVVCINCSVIVVGWIGCVLLVVSWLLVVLSVFSCIELVGLMCSSELIVGSLFCGCCGVIVSSGWENCVLCVGMLVCC